MRFGARWGTSWYGGAPVVDSASNQLVVALDGRPYMVDFSVGEFRFGSVPIQRDQSDSGVLPGRQTINPDAYWMRGADSWHLGAGQAVLDRDGSEPWRFRASKGIDPWTRWELSLLHDTESVRASAAVNQRLATAGGFLYLTDGGGLYVTEDLASWSTVTGDWTQDPTSIASDGWSVWTAHGTDGVYVTERGSPTSTSWATGEADLVAHVLGRWMAAGGGALYNVTATTAGALPDPLFTHPNPDWEWVAFAQAAGFIYAAGGSGDKSAVYAIGILEDGTGLDQPRVAAELPDGEVATALAGYLGFVLIGTTRGVRFAIPGASGHLEVGAVVEADEAVRCFEGQGKFVWFGWSDYENTDSGLGRLDLEAFAAPSALAPSYATDLMSGVTGDVLSVVTFDDRRVFTVAGQGTFAESDELVPLGTIDSGQVTYGLVEDKVTVGVDVRTRSPIASGSHEVLLDSGDGFSSLGVHLSETYRFPTEQARGDRFEVRLALRRSELDPTVGPVVVGWALYAHPISEATQRVRVPVLLAPVLDPGYGAPVPTDTWAELDRIVALCQSRRVVTWTVAGRTRLVVVEDFEALMLDTYSKHDSRFGAAFNGTVLLTMKAVT